MNEFNHENPPPGRSVVTIGLVVAGKQEDIDTCVGAILENGGLQDLINDAHLDNNPGEYGQMLVLEAAHTLMPPTFLPKPVIGELTMQPMQVAVDGYCNKCPDRSKCFANAGCLRNPAVSPWMPFTEPFEAEHGSWWWVWRALPGGKGEMCCDRWSAQHKVWALTPAQYVKMVCSIKAPSAPELADD